MSISTKQRTYLAEQLSSVTNETVRAILLEAISAPENRWFSSKQSAIINKYLPPFSEYIPEVYSPSPYPLLNKMCRLRTQNRNEIIHSEGANEVLFQSYIANFVILGFLSQKNMEVPDPLVNSFIKVLTPLNRKSYNKAESFDEDNWIECLVETYFDAHPHPRILLETLLEYPMSINFEMDGIYSADYIWYTAEADFKNPFLGLLSSDPFIRRLSERILSDIHL